MTDDATRRTYDEAEAALYEVLLCCLESRSYFVDVAVNLDPRDTAALVIGSVSPSGDGTATLALFRCASALDPDAEPVIGWMAECVAAARAQRPELFDLLGAVETTCLRQTKPGLVR